MSDDWGNKFFEDVKMKTYQEQWLEEIRQRDDKQDLLIVLDKIIADDTGGTDALTQELAKIIRRICFV